LTGTRGRRRSRFGCRRPEKAGRGHEKKKKKKKKKKLNKLLGEEHQGAYGEGDEYSGGLHTIGNVGQLAFSWSLDVEKKLWTYAIQVGG